MTNEILLRKAVKEDFAGLQNLLRQLNPEDPDADLGKAQSIWESIVSNRDASYILAEYQGRIVGACYLVVVPNLTRNNRPFGVIENVVVDPLYRRMGIASKILNFAKEQATEARCYKLMLMSNNKRKEAHRLYEKAGFEKDSKTAFDLRL